MRAIRKLVLSALPTLISCTLNFNAQCERTNDLDVARNNIKSLDSSLFFTNKYYSSYVIKRMERNFIDNYRLNYQFLDPDELGQRVFRNLAAKSAEEYVRDLPFIEELEEETTSILEDKFKWLIGDRIRIQPEFYEESLEETAYDPRLGRLRERIVVGVGLNPYLGIKFGKDIRLRAYLQRARAEFTHCVLYDVNLKTGVSFPYNDIRDWNAYFSLNKPLGNSGIIGLRISISPKSRRDENNVFVEGFIGKRF